MKTRLLAAVLALASLAVAGPSLATEGALGRSISGAQITPYIGIIPPTPGLQFSVSYLYLSGDIGAHKEVPIAGGTALNLHADMNLAAATLAYVWNTGQGRWNFASMFTLPYVSADINANLTLGRLSGRTSDSASDLYDVYFAPVIASYHVSQVEHWSFGVYVYAPTAEYTKGKLANPGLNVWTYSPAVGYTHLFQKGTLEFSALAGVDIYSRNNATDYQNGSVFRLDTLLMKRTPSGWGFGLAGGWIEQINNDTGPVASRLNGFKGRSIGVGPAIDFNKSWSKDDKLSLTLRYMPEFDVKNRIDGDPLVLNMSISL